MPKAALVISSALLVSLLSLAVACGGGEENPFEVQSELVTSAANPIAMAFAPDERLFYTEHSTGNVRIVTPDGSLQEEPFAQVDVSAKFDWGLNGIALDPEFETNHYVYVSFTEPATTEAERLAGVRIARPVVTRFTDVDGRGVDPEVIVGDLPETDPERGAFSAIGNIGFGPDGFLYIGMGDYDLFDPAQDLSVAQGKILRVDKEDGSAAPDNPFVDEAGADPRIFAYGFRKAFNFDFHPETGQMYATDHSGVTCDELNLIQAGANYGWPLAQEFRFGDCLEGQVTPPIYSFAPEGSMPMEPEAIVDPRGMRFLSGSAYPLLSGDSLLVCELRTQLLRRLVLGGANLDQVVEDDIVVDDCGLDIAISPDGIIYYSTEKEIRRLVPQ